MRKTKLDRWHSRLTSLHGTSLAGLFWRRCWQCEDDVKKEFMWVWRFRWDDRKFHYYFCTNCAPDWNKMWKILIDLRHRNFDDFQYN